MEAIHLSLLVTTQSDTAVMRDGGYAHVKMITTDNDAVVMGCDYQLISAYTVVMGCDCQLISAYSCDGV